MTLAAGTRFGAYEIRGLIGVGGMGEVYRATDTTLGREVALKVLPASFATDPDRGARFEREARTLAAFNHPNIAQIYDLERHDGTTALVMEIINGVTLAERIGRGPLPPREALAIAIQIAAGLEAAHEQGIVHRDLKPANVMLKADGAVKVLDFGISKALDVRAMSGSGAQAMTALAMTEAGVTLGTLPYMSPEQARGNPVDRRTDIWAFGCVLYEMLTGRVAFLGDDNASTLARVLERDPEMSRLPAELPPTVRRTLEACLQKDLRERPRDIGDVRLALEGRFSAAVIAPSIRPLWRRALPAAAALVIGSLGAATYVAMVARPAPPPQAGPVTRFVITPPATAPLSDLSGYDFAISPDGRRLAYLGQNASRNGVALYVRELDRLEPELIPRTEIVNPTQNVNPFFSPDGRSIGFATPEGNVVRVGVDGAPPQKMFASDSFYAAEWIAADEVVLAASPHLERVSLGGTGRREALTQDVANGLVVGPHLIPGRRAVLFTSVSADGNRVAVVDLDTGKEKILIEGGQKPSYANTGYLVFARGPALMAAPFNVAGLVVTGEPAVVLRNVRRSLSSNGAPDYALSDTGTLAYVPGSDAASARRGRLVWVDRAGRVVGRVADELLDYPHDPRLAPDGTRLVVTTGAFSNGRLWIYDLRGRPPIPLPDTNTGDGVWSPDGREIAFPSFNSPAYPISTVPADASAAPQPLGSAVAGIPQDWSSTGELLFGSGTDIRATRVAGGETRDVVATADAEFDAALSPDGHWLAYISDRTGRAEVWVQRYPEGVPMRVSPNGGYEPRWSADGREIFYVQEGGTMNAVGVETEPELAFAPPRQLFSGPYWVEPRADIRSYDVARDGRFLMIEPDDAAAASGAPGSIIVVQNWGEELKRLVSTK